MFHKLHAIGKNGDLWDKVCGLGSETWQWCHGAMVKHADSQHRGCQFHSSMCHF